jgi:hypothetical protein
MKKLTIEVEFDTGSEEHTSELKINLSQAITRAIYKEMNKAIETEGIILKDYTINIA